MKRTSLIILSLLLFTGGVWAEKKFFLDIYPKIFDKTITPLDYEIVSESELTYLKCEAKISVSSDFQGKRSKYYSLPCNLSKTSE